MDTVKELRRAVEDTTDDLIQQHGRKTPMCEVLHVELNLPQTLKDDDEVQKMLKIAEENHVELEDDSIKLTIEHEDLHEALRRFVVDSMSQGMDATQLAAHMLVVGRRMGLREAANLLGD